MKNEFNCKDIVITEQNAKALIISKDDENSILDTVIILPLSSSTLDDMFPYRVRIQNRDVSFCLILHRFIKISFSRLQK